MPIIVGTIRNAAGFPLALGRITVQLRQPLIDRSTTPDGLLTTMSQSYTITAGVINSPAVAGTTIGQINLPATVNEQVSYRFTIEQTTQTSKWFLNDGAEYPDNAPRVQNSGKWWTGATFVAGESREITAVTESTHTAILDPFDAILPDVTTIEIVDLIDFGAEFVSNPQAGLSYLAQLITTDTQYLNKLRAGRWVGPYSPAVVYQFGDIVSHGSPSQGWISKNASASTKIAPPGSGTTSNADWDYAPLVNVTNPSVNLSGLVQKAGDTMTGNLILPSPGGTPPNTIALRQAEADNLYVRLANTTQTVQGVKTFTGGLIVPNRTAGEATGNAANTAFVQGELNAQVVPRLLVTAHMDSTPTAISIASPVTNVGVTNLIFETELFDPTGRYNPSTGDFVAPATGTYEFECRLLIRLQNTTSSAGQDRIIMRLYLFNFTASGEVGNFALLNLPLSAIQTTYMLQGRVEARDIAASSVLVPRLAVNLNTTGNAYTVSPAIDTSQGLVQNMFRAFRLTN